MDLDNIQRNLKKVVPRKLTADRIYRLGYDCGFSGPNTTNCASDIFSTPENTAEWERGKKDGEEAKNARIQP